MSGLNLTGGSNPPLSATSEISGNFKDFLTFFVSVATYPSVLEAFSHQRMTGGASWPGFRAPHGLPATWELADVKTPGLGAQKTLWTTPGWARSTFRFSNGVGVSGSAIRAPNGLEVGRGTSLWEDPRCA